MKYYLYLLASLLIGCVPIDQSTSTNFVPKKIAFADFKYDPTVGTYYVYNQNALTPPITTLSSQNSLMLEFDVLGDEYEYLYAKIYHCNADWTKSSLNDLEFISQNNEFPINDYAFSRNALTLYTHYSFPIPQVNFSGNYVIAVYRDSNPQDLLLSCRFMVVENAVTITPDIIIPNLVNYRKTGQKVDMEISYDGINVKNPNTEIQVTVRQNRRWDNAKIGLKPTNIQFGNKLMEFNYFSGENTFYGGNEFRLFDLRTTSATGMNVAKLDVAENRRFALIATSQINESVVYSQPINQDINGNFFVISLEPAADQLDADYIYTSFTLLAPKEAYGMIYVIGEFNNWQASSKNAMYFDESLQAYRYETSLKQGFYNYTFYAPQADNPYPVDGSYFETENDYDVLVYHREIGTYHDRIVGYKEFSSND
ncbi:MAG: DUF5103 domain-containing protein [bacterium]|nr:DUF5103 domain-containing protein [bacterium]